MATFPIVTALGPQRFALTTAVAGKPARRYLLADLPRRTLEGCADCAWRNREKATSHAHLLGELFVAHPNDPGSNGASYREFLRWQCAEHVVIEGHRVAVVSPEDAHAVIESFEEIDLLEVG